MAPRMVVGAQLVNGPLPFFRGSVTIKSTNEIPAIIDSLHKEGYDFIKVYSFLRNDLFFTLAKYCNEKNIFFEGHVPIGVTAEDASNVSMKSIEHLFGLQKSFSAQSEKLMQQWEDEMLDTSVS